MTRQGVNHPQWGSQAWGTYYRVCRGQKGCQHSGPPSRRDRLRGEFPGMSCIVSAAVPSCAPRLGPTLRPPAAAGCHAGRGQQARRSRPGPLGRPQPLAAPRRGAASRYQARILTRHLPSAARERRRGWRAVSFRYKRWLPACRSWAQGVACPPTRSLDSILHNIRSRVYAWQVGAVISHGQRDGVPSTRTDGFTSIGICCTKYAARPELSVIVSCIMPAIGSLRA